MHSSETLLFCILRCSDEECYELNPITVKNIYNCLKSKNNRTIDQLGGDWVPSPDVVSMDNLMGIYYF